MTYFKILSQSGVALEETLTQRLVCLTAYNYFVKALGERIAVNK